MARIELTKEAEIKLTTLVECLNLDNESTVINELFYKFVLDQEPDKRRMIMAVYEIISIAFFPLSNGFLS